MSLANLSCSVLGVKVQYSSGKPRRVEVLQVKTLPCRTGNDCYHPVNMTKTYRVISDSYFIAKSNRIIIDKGRNRIRGSSTYDVLIDYLKFKYPVRNDIVNVAGRLCCSPVIVLFVMLVKVFL